MIYIQEPLKLHAKTRWGHALRVRAWRRAINERTTPVGAGFEALRLAGLTRRDRIGEKSWPRGSGGDAAKYMFRDYLTTARQAPRPRLP